jgi:hypothetical protein
MKTLALALIWLGVLLTIAFSLSAQATGRRWLHAIAAVGSSITFVGWVLLARANRRGGAR